MEILVTGVAGFIGFQTAWTLLKRGDKVIGVDSINDYYDTNLKNKRIEILSKYDGFSFFQYDISERDTMDNLFNTQTFSRVIHLAAQAGVRHSIDHPHTYIDSNVIGFTNILENARRHNMEHFTYASSSSVYGANEIQPFSAHHSVEHPLSLYAATKKSNELFAHSYSELYNLPTTGLRFFTAYGPWGRPDMALFIFTKAILEGRSIDVYNHGKMMRDFTYIDDIVAGIIKVSDNPAKPNPAWDSVNPDPASSTAPYKIYNIGNNDPIELLDFISLIEDALGKTATKNFLPMQNGDVPSAIADGSDIMNELDYKPQTNIQAGIVNFIAWYKEYYGI